ncbi:MAG: hypothetical protein QGH94_13830, partial [Phycisphaerae bacterium]|nr:hypothetical protein [Phycisphaerae bacterium]
DDFRLAVRRGSSLERCLPRRRASDPGVENDWPFGEIQAELLAQNAVLIYFKDLKRGAPHYAAAQFFAVRGFFGREGWTARLGDPVSETVAKQWLQWSGLDAPKSYKPGKTTRGELLEVLYAQAQRLGDEEANQLRGKSSRAERAPRSQ